MFIEESQEDKIMEQHFVEVITMQKDVREGNVVATKEQLSIECRWKYNKPQRCRRWRKHNKGRWKWRGMNRKL
jgi:hypothetical protein